MSLPRYALLLLLSTGIAVGGSGWLVLRAFEGLRRGEPWPGTGPFWMVGLAAFLVMAGTDLVLRFRRAGVVIPKPGPGRPPASRLLVLGLVVHAVLSGGLVLLATGRAPLGLVPGGWWVSLLIPTGCIGALWLTVYSRARFHERRLLRR